MNTETKTDLQKHVDAIAHGIQNGVKYETCLDCHGDLDYDNFDDVRDPCSGCEHYHGLTMDAIHYLSDVLDIQYIVTGAGEYLAARILVAFGGPNIWINTQTKKNRRGLLVGAIARSLHIITHNEMDIDGACSELWDLAALYFDTLATCRRSRHCYQECGGQYCAPIDPPLKG
jgi:hypothetical protein